MYVVYALVDPRDNTIRYVGITTDVYQRFQEHIQCSSGNFAKNAWIMELRAANKMVIMETLEEVETRNEAELRESYWIQHFQMLREPIHNISKTSSPRKSKKTNARVGQKIAQEVAVFVQKTVQRSAQHERFMNIHVVSDEEKASILGAAQTQMNMTGKVIRTKVRDDLGWNNAQFPKIKQVLDEEGL